MHSKCALCDVNLHSESDTQKHYAGNKHRKMAEAKRGADDLIARSVYLTGKWPV